MNTVGRMRNGLTLDSMVRIITALKKN